MFMRRLPALALAALVASPAPAFALDKGGFGAGLGLTANGAGVTTLNYTYRPFGAFSEAGVSYVGRGLALARDSADAVESNGLAVNLGLTGFSLRGGVSAEAHVGRRVQAVAAGRLSEGPYAAFLVEPYVGLLLPWLTTGFSQVDLTLYWPVLRTDPAEAFQPRLMLTVLLGLPKRSPLAGPALGLPEGAGEDDPADDGLPNVPD